MRMMAPAHADTTTIQRAMMSGLTGVSGGMICECTSCVCVVTTSGVPMWGSLVTLAATRELRPISEFEES